MIDIQAAVAAAVAAAGPRGDNDAAWRANVNDAIPFVVAMMHERSLASTIATEVAEAAVFVATFLGYEVEASSKRCLVRLDTGKPSRNYADGIEPIRSHRTDNPQGQAMKRRLDQLATGTEIVVWKTMEKSATGDSVRTLVHFEERPQQDARPPAASSGGRPVESSGGRDEPPPVADSAGSSGTASDVSSRAFGDLDSRTKLRVVQRFREEGIQFPTPADDQVNRFHAIIDEEVAR